MFLRVLDVPKGGLQVLFGHRSNKALPWLVCSNTIVASNVQLGCFMKFAMERFNPYPLAPNSLLEN